MGVLGTDDRFLFLHIPKTGGTSISAALAGMRGSRFSADKELIAGINQFRDLHGSPPIKNVDHADAKEVRHALGPERFDAMEKVAVIRSPWDRIRSFYRYQRQRPRSRVAHFYLEIIDLPFGEFVVQFCRKLPRNVSDYITDNRGDLLVDSVLHFETLDADFFNWSERVFGKQLALDRLNTTHSEGELEYSTAAIAAVRAQFAADIERFDFPNSPLE